VYAGWHWEHTSTVRDGLVERVSKVVPHDAQVTVVATRVG
jgi:hypothetical protein